MSRNFGNGGGGPLIQMPAELQTMQPVPMLVLNPPIPSLDPFVAILTAQFLQKNVWLEEFTFTASWNTLSANAVGQTPTVAMSIDPGIDFLAMELNLTAYSDVNTIVANPNYLLEITETSGRMVWADAPVHVSNITGQNRNSGSRPYHLVVPRYVRGNNTVTMKLTNLTATAARVDLAMPGYRVTYLNGLTRDKLFPIPN